MGWKLARGQTFMRYKSVTTLKIRRLTPRGSRLQRERLLAVVNSPGYWVESGANLAEKAAPNDERLVVADNRRRNRLAFHSEE